MLIASLGALYGASLPRLVLNLRHSRTLPLGPTIILTLLSVLVLYSHFDQAASARVFLATADSAKGVVTQTFRRDGPRLVATYEVASQAYRVISPPGVDSLARFAAGDSIWLYFPPEAPDSAHFGHPSADASRTRRQLLWIWLGAGPILWAYGSNIFYYLRPSTYAVPTSTA